MIAFTIVVAVMIAVNVAVWMFIYRSLDSKKVDEPISITDLEVDDINSLGKPIIDKDFEEDKT